MERARAERSPVDDGVSPGRQDDGTGKGATQMTRHGLIDTVEHGLDYS